MTCRQFKLRRLKSFKSFVLFVLFPSSPLFANGAGGFFIENLPRAENNVLGYAVHYVSPTSSGDWEGYCLNNIKLEENWSLIPFQTSQILGFKDTVPGSGHCSEDAQEFQLRDQALNSKDLLLLSPLSPKAKKITKIKSLPFPAAIKNFGFFKSQGHVPDPSMKIGNQHIDFLAGFDLDGNGEADLLVFTRSVDYTHTYLIGKKSSGWAILKNEYPL